MQSAVEKVKQINNAVLRKWHRFFLSENVLLALFYYSCSTDEVFLHERRRSLKRFGAEETLQFADRQTAAHLRQMRYGCLKFQFLP